MDEQTLGSRSHVSSQEDFKKTKIGTYVRFVLIFEKSRPRGYAEDVVNDYEALLDDLDVMLAQKNYLTILPGTFIKNIEADYAEKNGCLELSCMNDGICVDLANDFVCRCKMEFYGKKCQHMKYHTPDPLEVPVIAVTSNQARLKWIRPPEDPSIGATIEHIRMWNGEGVDTTFEADETEVILKVAPEEQYSFNFQIVYANGLRSRIKTVYVKAAPVLNELVVTETTDSTVTLNFTTNAMITSYNIFQTEKNEKGQDVFGELLWSGVSPPATIYNLESDKFYKLAMLGYVQDGTTDTLNVKARTALSPPTLDWERLKVGWTSALIAWNPVKNALGYTVEVFESGPNGEQIPVQDFTVDKDEDRLVDIRKLGYDSEYVFRITTLGNDRQGDSPTIESSFRTEPRPITYNKPVKLSVSEIKTSEARLTWTKPDYNVKTQYLYRNDEEPLELGPDITDFIMQNFAPHQSYIVSLVVVDEDDVESERGEGVKLTTAPVFPEVTVESAETELIYKWSTLHSAKEFKLRPSLGNRKYETVRAEQVMYRRTKLKPNTEYSFEIYAVIDENTETDKVEVKIKTSPRLTSFTAMPTTNAEDNSVTVIWPEQKAFESFSFSLEPKLKQGRSKFLVEAREQGQVEIGGLMPGTTYNITIHGRLDYKDRQIKSSSTSLMATTALNAPYILTAEDALIVTNRSIEVTWNEVANAYKYEARIESEVDRRPKHVTAGLKNVAEWKALEPNTEYVIQIRAVSGYEEVPNSKWSEIIIRTAPNAPELYVTSTGPNGINLSVSGLSQFDTLFYQTATDWDDENSIITYEPIMIEDDTSNFDFYLPNLAPGTDHQIRMSITTENGDACYPKWAEVSASTEPAAPDFIVDATSTGFVITWRAHADVEVVMLRIVEKDIAFAQTIEEISAENPIIIEGFHPWSEYTIQLKAIEGASGQYMATKWSDKMNYRTDTSRMLSQHVYQGKLDLNSNGMITDPFVVGQIESEILEQLNQSLDVERVERIQINQIIPEPDTIDRYFVLYEIEFQFIVPDEHAALNGLVQPPPAPVGLDISLGGRGEKSVDLEWYDYAKSTKQDGMEGYAHSRYEYQVRCFRLGNEIRREIIGGALTAVKVVDLLPSDLCTVRLRAEVEKMWSRWSDPLFFSTLPKPPMIKTMKTLPSRICFNNCKAMFSQKGTSKPIFKNHIQTKHNFAKNNY